MKSGFPTHFYFTSHNSTNVKFEATLDKGLSEHADKIVTLDRNPTCGATDSGCLCEVHFSNAPETITLKCQRFDEDDLGKWPLSVRDRHTEKHDVKLELANCNITDLYPVNKYVPEVRKRLSKLVLSGNYLTSLDGLEKDLPALKVSEIGISESFSKIFISTCIATRKDSQACIRMGHALLNNSNPKSVAWKNSFIMEMFRNYFQDTERHISNTG